MFDAALSLIYSSSTAHMNIHAIMYQPPLFTRPSRPLSRASEAETSRIALPHLAGAPTATPRTPQAQRGHPSVWTVTPQYSRICEPREISRGQLIGSTN